MDITTIITNKINAALTKRHMKQPYQVKAGEVWELLGKPLPSGYLFRLAKLNPIAFEKARIEVYAAKKDGKLKKNPVPMFLWYFKLYNKQYGRKK